MWDGARLEDEIVKILERAGFKTLTSLTQISRSALREILGGQSMIGILEGMRRRGLSLQPVSEDEKDVILLPLDTTFSLRTGNCFKNEGVTTVGQLMEFTEAELLQWPNFGRKSINETKVFLASLGLALKQ